MNKILVLCLNAFNPSTGETHTGRLEITGCLWLLSLFTASPGLYLKMGVVGVCVDIYYI